MRTEKVVVQNILGLHGRPAVMFMQKAALYQAEINLEKGGRTYNAKSLIQTLSARVLQGEEITIGAEGIDENEAIEALVELISENFVVSE